MQEEPAGEFAPLADVAAAYGVSVDTIRRRMRRGEVEARREATPSGFKWLVRMPPPEEQAASNAAQDAPRSPRAGETREHGALALEGQTELIEALRGQLAVKDQQIRELHEILARQAQTLQLTAAAGSSVPADRGEDRIETSEPAASGPASAWQRLRRRLAARNENEPVSTV
jgi:hypothetical protein